jgi:isopenicillin N synthase-like dioxygenase
MGITSEVPKTVQWSGKQVPVYPMQTVDFSQLLSQEPAEIEKLVRCCQTEGFFYIDLQGIDGRRMLDDQQETLKLMNRFFESPLEVKNEYGLVAPHLGYEPVGSRTGVLANTKDGYEMIKVSYMKTISHRHINSCLKVSRDEIQADSPHIPRNIKNNGDIKVLENAIAGSNIITKTILSALSTGLGLTGAARFENMHRNHRPSTSTLAMMHYIPSDPVTDKNIGHQKHTDISSLTLLFSEQWGLQIRPPGKPPS